jgi:DNA-binding NtrC family response regulator
MRSKVEAVSLPVLVIAQDPATCETLSTVLEQGGYPVMCADSQDALDRWAKAKVCGVVWSAGNKNDKGTPDVRTWLSVHRPDLKMRVVELAGDPKGAASGPAHKEWPVLQGPLQADEFLSMARKVFGKPPATSRILVVDDEGAIRGIVTNMLTSYGYRVCSVAGGLQALALLNSGERFDLVTSDLLNRPMDGTVLLERMTEEYPDTSVMIISCVSDLAVVHQALRNGAYDYLIKPFEKDTLYFAVRRALEHRSLKLENRALRVKLAQRKTKRRI